MITSALHWIDRHPARAGTLAGWYQQACGLVAAVVAVPLVIRLLPPGEAGLWFFFQSVLGILQLTDFGFTLVLSRQIAFSLAARSPLTGTNTDFLDLRPGWEGISDVYTLTRRIFRWICGIGFIVIAVLYHAVIPAGRILEHRTPETALSWYVLGLSTLLVIQAKPHQALLDGMAKVYLTRMLTGTQQLLSGLGVVAVLLIDGRFIHMALAVLGTALLYYLGTRWCVHHVAGRHLERPMPIPRNHRVKFLRVAAPLGILSLSAFMVLSVQVPLIGFLLGAAAVPAFYLAQRLGTVLNQTCLQFMFPQLPLFTQQIGARQYADAAHRMRRSLALTGVLVAMVNLLFYVASPTLVNWWVGPGRYLTGMPLLVLALDFAMMNFAGGWGAFVLARGRNPFVMSTLLSGAINLTLCLTLGSQLGLLGFAMATLLAGLLTNYWFVPLQGIRLLKELNRSSI